MIDKTNGILIFQLLRREKLRRFLLLVLILLALTLIEFFTFFQIYPFIQILTTGMVDEGNYLLKFVNFDFEENSDSSGVIILSISLIITIILRAKFTWLYFYWSTKFSFNIAKRLHLDLIKDFTDISYLQYKNLLFSDFIKFHLKELPSISVVISNALLVVAESLIFLILFSYVFFISPSITLVSIVLIGLIFAINKFLIMKKLLSLDLSEKQMNRLSVQN